MSLVGLKVEYYKRVIFLLIMLPNPHDALPCSNHPIVYFLILRAVDFVVLYKEEAAWLSGAP